MEWTEADTKIFQDVQDYGWHVMIVADEPPFAYTIGLFARFKQPELIVFGMSHKNLHTVCNAYGNQIRDSIPPTPETYLYSDAVLRPVIASMIPRYLGVGKWFYRGNDFPVLQLVFADPQGRFPWDEGGDAALKAAQPMLWE